MGNRSYLLDLTTHNQLHCPAILPPVCGHVLVQLVEALRYQLEGRGFDS
jgi:hypothetical protein